jgi:transcription initiation factor IIE alpha subunit
MKKIIILTVAFLVASTCIFAQTKAGRKDTTQHAVLYTCPSHPGVSSHQPGKCPICGMDLHLSGKEQMKAEVMKNYSCPVHLDVTAHDPGKCPKCGKKLNLSPKEQMKAEVMKIYTCPMHPEIALDKEGNCPKCGGALVAKKQHS